MSRSEAEDLLRDWSIGWAKVFQYKEWIAIPETLIISKDLHHEYSIDKHKSTTNKAGPWDKDELIRLLITGVMAHLPNHSVNTDYKYERTGGCECGAWRTKDSNCHAFWCKKHSK